MSDPYVGEIRLLGFSRVPNGWLPCNGSLQPISQYDVLFTDRDNLWRRWRDHLRAAKPQQPSSDSLRLRPGLSPHILGEIGGSELVTLLSTQIPQHDHPMVATTTEAANSDQITQKVEFGAVSGDTMYANDVTGAASAATALSCRR
jgi:microcystin-dependent protein